MILAGFPEDPMKSDHKQTRDAIERIFYDELCKSDDMKEIVRHYERQDPGHSDRTYEFLRREARKVQERKKHRENRSSLASALASNSLSMALAAPGATPKRSRPCNYYQKGKCKNGANCQYSHDLPAKKSNDKNKGGGGGRGGKASDKKGSSKFGNKSGGSKSGGSKSGDGKSNQQKKLTAAEKKQRPCFMFNKGSCKKGDQCDWAHRTWYKEEKSKYEEGQAKRKTNGQHSAAASDSGTGSSSQGMSNEQKAKTPCRFFAKGKCNRSPCPFLHSSQAAPSQAAGGQKKKRNRKRNRSSGSGSDSSSSSSSGSSSSGRSSSGSNRSSSSSSRKS